MILPKRIEKGRAEKAEENILEMMQPMPVPLAEMESQHSRTPGELQAGALICGEGRAEAAMAAVRMLRRVWASIVTWYWIWVVIDRVVLN